ncbi:MAG: hypothetical protein JW910_12255 [Anaerolineae bacterium]|nr:hypothetical protein [Anaerolineae bacterium]
MVDVDEMPDPKDLVLIGSNPRYRDGKPVRNILAEVNSVIWPWERIVFAEVMPGQEEEEVYGFYRD